MLAAKAAGFGLGSFSWAAEPPHSTLGLVPAMRRTHRHQIQLPPNPASGKCVAHPSNHLAIALQTWKEKLTWRYQA